MSKAQWALAGSIYPIILMVSTVSAFADNPTPNYEWDFDFGFSEMEAYQEPYNLNQMVITSDVSFEGTKTLGTVIVSAKITQPDGTDFTLRDRIHDLENGQIFPVRLGGEIRQEGIYTIQMKMTPPEPYDFHVFDSESITFEIPRYGFENKLKTLSSDSKEMITYYPENPISIQYFEAAHAVIDLPESHTFEKITVTNGDYTKEFDINTKDIYLTSRQGYENMQVSLIKENLIIPMADAQNAEESYVTFYKVNKEMCSFLVCYSIDNIIIHDEEFPIWVLGFLGIGAIIPFVMRKKTTSPSIGSLQKPIVSP